VSTAAYYPVVLDLSERRCVVLGDSEIASEKVTALRAIGASVVHARRPFQLGDLVGALLAIDASGDPASQAGARAEADREHVLLNVVDVAQRCDWIAPAVVRRGPLQVAISTSGESPFLASMLRARIERWLGREWGPFVALVGEVRRRLRNQGLPIAEQTRVYRRLLNSDLLSLLRARRTAEANRLAAGIAAAQCNGAGRVALVGAGPGDPDLLTVKARDLIAGADYVLHDALIAPDTLALCGPDTRLENVGKRGGRGGRASARQANINARLIELARAGHHVVRLKGGDPFVFGRGGEELDELRRAGIDVAIVPGVSSALAAPAAAGIPVTRRGVASSVAITTAQGGGSIDRLPELARAADTLVVLMSLGELSEVAAVLGRAVGGSRPAAVISNATLPNQRTVRGTLDSIGRLAADAAIEAPATLIVGDVVAVEQVVGLERIRVAL
jgi:uroporphyrin-III C-methyltransferase / precorrin-2 dehydrogenase / sirohydrochlorin ferrochelatase